MSSPDLVPVAAAGQNASQVLAHSVQTGLHMCQEERKHQSKIKIKTAAYVQLPDSDLKQASHDKHDKGMIILLSSPHVPEKNSLFELFLRSFFYDISAAQADD